MTAIDDRPRTDWSGQLAGIDVAGELEIECAPPKPEPMTLEELIALQNRTTAARRAAEHQRRVAELEKLERLRREVFEGYYCYCSPSRGALFQEPRRERRARRRVSPMAVALVMIAYMAMLIVLVGVM